VFNGSAELRQAPERSSGKQILQMGKEQAAYLRDGGDENGGEDPVKSYGVKRVNNLFELPYWAVSDYCLLFISYTSIRNFTTWRR